jgi:phenylacetaldehyde dehydrogenase
MLIGDEWRSAKCDETIDVFNPADGSKLGSVAAAGKEDVDMAVAAARRAFDEGLWVDMLPTERAKIMFRIADMIESRVEEFAHAEVLENGMPLALARYCVSAGAEMFRYFGGWVTKIHGQTSTISMPMDFHSYTLRQPVGVVGLIVAWNGPFTLACQKMAPALAAGCTVVLKPSEETPLNTLRLGRLMLEAGLPQGVINIVPGYGSTAGEALINHPDIDKISFTGSTAVGKRIVQAAAGNMKRLTLELGGKSPVIVLNDADIEKAIPGILSGIMTNSGQMCIAGSRLYVQRGIWDGLLEGLASACESMKVGNGMEADTALGPLISQKQLNRVMGYIEHAVAEGVQLVTGGRRVGETGHFITPTILAGPGEQSAVMREEIFGPVLCAVPFDDPAEAVRLANNTRFGLAGAVYTRDIGHAHRLARQIRGGSLFINCHGIFDNSMPFGGFRESGWGREGGAEGLGAYLETKSVYTLL